MKEFYFEDKKRNIAFRGIEPNNDIDWLPIQYLILPHLLQRTHTYIDNYRHVNNLNSIDEQTESFFKKKAFDEVMELINSILINHKCPTAIETLLKQELLPKRQQEKLLKDISLTGDDIVCIMDKAQQLGYLLDIYKFEVLPDRYKEKKKPLCFHLRDDNTIEVIGETDMTEGEMKALLKERKIIIVRLFHNDEHWHCFYHTLRGIAGEEPGILGSKPHWHYISDKFGFTRDELVERFRRGDAPSSKSHIVIDRNAF